MSGNSNSNSNSSPMLDAVAVLLRPLARLLIARGFTYDGFAEAAKHAFLKAAEQDFAIEGKRQTGSRISVLTGLTRKEVARLQSENSTRILPDDRKLNRAAKVVSGWVRKYGSGRSRRQTLPVEGERASFATLVREYSGDMPVQAVLDELVRTGTVSREKDGRVRLVTRVYLANTDKADKVIMLGTDAADLIACIAHNLDAAPGETFFQRKTTYDNLPASRLAPVRAALAEEGQQFLERFDSRLAEMDRDVNGQQEVTDDGGRTRAVVGLYYFEEPFDPSTAPHVIPAPTKRVAQ